MGGWSISAGERRSSEKRSAVADSRRDRKANAIASQRVLISALRTSDQSTNGRFRIELPDSPHRFARLLLVRSAAETSEVHRFLLELSARQRISRISLRYVDTPAQRSAIR